MQEIASRGWNLITWLRRCGSFIDGVIC